MGEEVSEPVRVHPKSPVSLIFERELNLTTLVE
jgi:hypothetical protein